MRVFKKSKGIRVLFYKSISAHCIVGKHCKQYGGGQGDDLKNLSSNKSEIKTFEKVEMIE